MQDHPISRRHYRAATYTASTSIGYLVARSHALLLDMMEPAFANLGVTFIQYVILANLRDGMVANPKDICAEFRHDSGALTRVIDQLAARGFLERTRGLRDRRKVDLRLTASGRKTVETLIPTVVDRLNCALDAFNGAEIREFTRLLVKLNAALQSKLESPARTGTAASET